MDREYGARDALAFVRRTDFAAVERRVRRRVRARGVSGRGRCAPAPQWLTGG